MLQNVLCGEKGVVHWWDLTVGEIPQLTFYVSHFKFLHKDKKTYLGFAQMYSSYCVVQRNSPKKKATIHQTTANSYQQWEQHNDMGQIFDAFYVIMENIRWHYQQL